MVLTYDDLVNSISYYQHSLLVRAQHVIQESTNRADGDNAGITIGNFIEIKKILLAGKVIPDDEDLLKTMISMIKVYSGELATEFAGNALNPQIVSALATEVALSEKLDALGA